ncbi:GH1 family beta-glucosidase [Streptomyces sp. SID13031]|uniref:GH1 family beta-glucosidase n=1 Tax=Streptomyces sp. SID13031 TaxID=2706046 RepID=UPI0013CDA7FC|nr:GH1 family beta-glucosidase [Streptomyces sp. SID13031]NEA33895.1 beta-glucosidase [Streptomyces sp. SID13031]
MVELSPLRQDFVWGTATSAYQIEGAIDADGRLPSIWDTFCRVPGAIDNGDTGDVACDSYHRWPEDLDLLKQLGVDAYRFSIAWPRVIPTGSGAVNAAGLAYYDKVVDDLLANGIKPYVTLYHWDLPQALQELGGWENRDTAYRFAEYAAVVGAKLGDRVTDWVTLNEPLCSAWIGHWEGRMAPGIKDPAIAVRASYNLMLAHGLGVAALRESAPKPPEVGLVVNLSGCEPATSAAADIRAAQIADGHINRWWLDPLFGRGFPADMVEVYGVELPEQPGDAEIIAAPTDFVGLNYYFRQLIKADESVPVLGFSQVPGPNATHTMLDWEVHPAGLEELILRLAKEYGAEKIYITENGSAWVDEPDADFTVDDTDRTAYLDGHLAACVRAVQQGAPLAGYFAWSLMDNFEWAYGYAPRFGLAYVDYPTGKRVMKTSGKTYTGLIKSHRPD